MQPFSREQCLSWCEERGVTVSSRDELSYGLAEAHVVDKQFRRGRGFLGQAAMITFKANDEPFEGGLVYVRPEHVQPETWTDFWGVAEVTLGLLRRVPEVRENLEKLPGQYFAPEDQSVALAYVIQVMLFAIDAYFVPARPDYIAYFSHDEFISLSCRDRAAHSIMSRALE